MKLQRERERENGDKYRFSFEKMAREKELTSDCELGSQVILLHKR